MKKTDNLKRRKYLAAAIALFLSTSPLSVSAKDYVASGDYILSENIEAYGKDFAVINYVSENTNVNSILENKKPLWSIAYNKGDAVNITDAIKKGIFYWSDMLGKYTKNKTPWQIFVNTDLKQNASAGSGSFIVDADGKNTEVSDAFVSQQLQDGKDIDELTPDIVKDGSITKPGTYAFSEITIGKYMGADTEGKSLYGWYVDENTVLPTNEASNDFIGTVRHEMGHALGIGLSKEFRNWDGKVVTEDKDKVKTSDGKYLMQIASDVADKDTWTLHLRDQNDNPAKAGMPIVTSQGFADLKEIYPDLKESDCFIVDNDMTSDGKGYAYFYGDNVSEVLDGATFFGRNALPVNGWEDKDTFEGAHLQTSGMMSHRDFSNYTAFMEAELAVMQDLGYTIDRKAYFGYSVYGNDKTITNKNGYSARNEDGTAYTNEYSEVPLGIGLHVYGARNNVTQEASVLTKGDGATGVRVDGSENTVNIAQGSEIHADGNRGNGLLVSYGRNQTINQYGDVTAKGEGGVGARFDFGSSSNGAGDEYRGSYIRYKREVNEDGNIDTAKNLNLTEMTANEYNNDTSELEGAQVKEYNIAGELTGGSGDNGHAVYIAKNAFVKDININKGAKISGNITNDWKHFTASDYNNMGLNKSPIKIQYNGKYGNDGYDYTEYIPDLVTNINVNTDMVYDGKITGADNTKLNVNKSVLVNSGEADVVNVTVAETAGVYGGTYTVNDMTEKIAPGFTDDTTGKFINHGAIGAYKDHSLKIKGAGDNNGKLVSDGVIVSYAGATNPEIEVEGTADIEGSAVTALNYVPDESSVALTASEGITGNLANSTQTSGMMNTEAKKDGDNNLVVTAVESNNLGDTTSEQKKMYNAMNSMRKNMQSTGDAAGVDEMRTLYNLDATSAKSALSDMGNSAAGDMAAIAQQNSAVNNIIGERLTTAYEKTDLDPTINSDIWVNFAKDWGETRSGANYHASAISGGYDKAIGKNWRLGGFVSYNSMNLSAKNAGGNVYDTRAGVYALYKKDATDAFIYADLGWLRNKNRRGISALGLSTENKYGGHIAELGGEYKRELHNNQKIWRVSPYFNLQLSHLTQGGYTENDMGVYGQKVDSLKNTYFAGQIGMEFKRVAKMGNYGARVGIKHAFSGADPDLSYNFIGDASNRYSLRGDQDKTHFILRFFGNVSSTDGWQLGGDAKFQKGSHDKDVVASVTLKKLW